MHKRPTKASIRDLQIFEMDVFKMCFEHHGCLKDVFKTRFERYGCLKDVFKMSFVFRVVEIERVHCIDGVSP